MTYTKKGPEHANTASEVKMSVSLIFLVFFWLMLAKPRSSVAQCGNQEAHLWLLQVWDFLEPLLAFLFLIHPDSHSSHVKLSLVNVIISRCQAGLLVYCLSTLSPQHPPHKYAVAITPPPPPPNSCTCSTVTPEVSAAQWEWTWMFARSNNLIRAGRGIHEETRRWLLWLPLQL